jgi:(5-formylfuran-3-yl)methyl phosphate synthase
MLLRIIRLLCKVIALPKGLAPQLLASVTSVNEAQLALDADVDIIDLKNPTEGALGALSLKTIQQIVALIDKRKLVSATIGDLLMDPLLIEPAVQAISETGVDIVKIGFFGSEEHLACAVALKKQILNGTKVVAVLFADQCPNFDFMDNLKAIGFYGVMLDTADKSSGGLLNNLSLEDLYTFTQKAKSLNLVSGLAGSLMVNDIPLLKRCYPDYLGFRGALCDSLNRRSEIVLNQVLNVKDTLLLSF